MDPLISVVIPSYNNLELFKKALNSVLDQTYKSVEVIISDDSTSDEIEKFCASQSDNRIVYTHNIPSKGAVKNWNQGLQMASGDWIIVLHHDEQFGSLDYLMTLTGEMNTNDILISEVMIENNGQLRNGKFTGFIKSLILKYPSLFFIINPIGPCACVAFNKNILQLFDDHLVWRVDMEWYYRIFRCSQKRKYLPYLHVLSHHGHEDQITNNIDKYSKSKADIDYLQSKYGYRFLKVFLLFISKIRKFTGRS